MPDLNSLPPSRSLSSTPHQTRVHSNNLEPLNPSTAAPSPHSSSLSLAASATINAGIQHEGSRRSSSSSNRNRPPVSTTGRTERRRSNVAMNLNLAESNFPGASELPTRNRRSSIGHQFRAISPHSLGGSLGGSPTLPYHQRTPSLGELHQELEQEQEAQVNRLLEMIRQQQAQLQQIQRQSTFTPSSSTAAVDDSTPTSERSFSFPTVPAALPVSTSNPRPRSPVLRSSIDLSRQSSRRSRTPSHAGSPSLRPLSAGLYSHGDEWLLSGGNYSGRDESAFYQAETQMLTRENQMLRLRIQQLERQLGETNSINSNSPATSSNLAAPPIEVETSSASRTTAEHENKD